MSLRIRFELSLMMFLQFFIWGAWAVTMGTYLGKIGFQGVDIGNAYSTTAWAAILSPFFVGVIIIPTIGNVAEHLVAMQLAWRNRIEFSLAVAFGSSLQVALFVAPVLVLLGLVVGQPMDLAFPALEVAAVGVAVAISALVALDGESNWLEGLLLVAIYAILAVTFFELV